MLPFVAFCCLLPPFATFCCLLLPFAAFCCLLPPFAAFRCLLLPFAAFSCLFVPWCCFSERAAGRSTRAMHLRAPQHSVQQHELLAAWTRAWWAAARRDAPPRGLLQTTLLVSHIVHQSRCRTALPPLCRKSSTMAGFRPKERFGAGCKEEFLDERDQRAWQCVCFGLICRMASASRLPIHKQSSTLHHFSSLLATVVSFFAWHCCLICCWGSRRGCCMPAELGWATSHLAASSVIAPCPHLWFIKMGKQERSVLGAQPAIR